jgi:RNA polymerase-associated protein CTR9
MNTALKYAQKALHLQPSDKAILYNIAMVQQKSAELLFGLSPSKRTLKDLEWAILQAGHAQRLFASLAADSASVVPYSRDIADQRRKYGESMLRRGDEHLATQKEFEAEAQAKLVAARLRRQMERDKLEAIEQEKIEEHRRQAEKLAEERRKAREQAQEWTREVQMESDEERERKSKRAAKKVKVEGESGDEGAEPKKKKRSGGKLKKAIDQDIDNEQLFSDDEVDNKPAKKRVPKKRVVRDDDDQDAVGGPRKKQYKSKEIISDTDDEDMS